MKSVSSDVDEPIPNLQIAARRESMCGSFPMLREYARYCTVLDTLPRAATVSIMKPSNSILCSSWYRCGHCVGHDAFLPLTHKNRSVIVVKDDCDVWMQFFIVFFVANVMIRHGSRIYGYIFDFFRKVVFLVIQLLVHWQKELFQNPDPHVGT